MTNTYLDNAPLDVKTFEELRCLRCVLERLLTSLDPVGFKDYQLEKFSGSAEARAIQRNVSSPIQTVPEFIELNHVASDRNVRISTDHWSPVLEAEYASQVDELKRKLADKGYPEIRIYDILAAVDRLIEEDQKCTEL